MMMMVIRAALVDTIDDKTKQRIVYEEREREREREVCDGTIGVEMDRKVFFGRRRIPSYSSLSPEHPGMRVEVHSSVIVVQEESAKTGMKSFSTLSNTPGDEQRIVRLRP